MTASQTVPVTAQDFTAEACRQRLERLLESPSLKITVQGGGIEAPRDITAPSYFLVPRDELVQVVRHLSAGEPFTPEEIRALNQAAAHLDGVLYLSPGDRHQLSRALFALAGNPLPEGL